jgi:hypothetical protein
MSDDGAVHSTSGGGMGGQHPDDTDFSVLVAPATGGELNNIRLRLIPVACWRVDDIRFAFDSSFVVPEIATEIKQLWALREDHKKPDPVTLEMQYPTLSVFGHADPVGPDDYNKSLSGRRAKAIYAMIISGTDPDKAVRLWKELAKAENWGDDQRQAMRDSTGSPDGTSDDDLFQAYMTQLCVIRDKNGNQTLDSDGKPAKLTVAATQFLGGGSDAQGKADYQGCSSFNPQLLFSQTDEKRYQQAQQNNDQEVLDERNSANAPNRRVVVLLFRPGSKVLPQKWPCPRASEGVAGCIKRFWVDGQKRRKTHLPDDQRKFEDKQDTFACRFYQRITDRSPCEAGTEQCSPTLFYPEQPDASNWVRAQLLWVYVAHFLGGGSELESVRRYTLKEGKLWDDGAGKNAALDRDRPTWFYFTHRDDLLSLDQVKWFTHAGKGLPLLGPISVPCGSQDDLNIDIWQQKDWAIVHGPRVDGVRLDKVKMTEWKEDYHTGQLLPFADGSGMGFFPMGDFRKKQVQETWKGGTPIDLVHLGNPDTNPMWVGTLSALPAPKAKLLLVHQSASAGEIFATSYNEIAPTGRNQDFPGHHRYNQGLVNQLLSVPSSGQKAAGVDSLPNPPARLLLPGDMCWQDQGQTNNCGAFSFSTAMNYWMPYTNNPGEKDGTLYSKPGNVPDLINGARTPANIVEAANRFKMNGRDNDAEDLDKTRALKLVKLWLMAGVPVLILVKEEYNLFSYHWKTVAGYDGGRFFMNNSGADNEVITARRTPGTDYEHAPEGNDVDSESAFWGKWKAAGGDIVDKFTSVDECTFIPLYPKDGMFASGAAV